MTHKERALIDRIRNESGDVITETTEIQRIIRDYFENLYAKE